MELEKNKFLIVGLGITGKETLKFLHSRGANVKATDSRKIEQLEPEITNLASQGAQVHCGSGFPELFQWADIIVLSPGVMFSLPEVIKAKRLGKTVISETEFAWRFVSKPVIGVTGTNGKTTTTLLLSEMLKQSGIKAFTGGNIGTPLVSVAGKDSEFDFLLLELSSFQLQGTIDFAPHVAVMLNISPNHLDHHKDMKEYRAAKFKIFANQSEKDWAVLNSSDHEVVNGAEKICASKISFAGPNADVQYEKEEIKFRDTSFSLKRTKLKGTHNRENIMAAVATAILCGCDADAIQQSIDKFRPLPHRMEFVLNLNGVDIYNDSKSTSPFATLRAIESLPSPIVLVAGGKDKQISYECLKKVVATKVKGVVLMGEVKEKMRAEFEGLTETVCVDSIEDAALNAFEMSGKGDTILFSPACSSFDMFSSYEQRGELFKELIRNV